MSNYSVGDFIIAPGRCLGMISSVHKKEVTIIWKDNGLSAKYTFSQIKGFNYQHILKGSQFKIGDRFEITTHKKYSGERGYLSGYHTDDSPEFWVKLDNYDLQIRVFPSEVKFLEDETQEAIVECLHNLTSAQELGQDSPLPQQFLEDSNLLELLKLMNTAQTSSVSGSPMSITTAMCEASPAEISETSGQKSTSSQLRRRASRSASRGNARGRRMSATVSPPSNEQLSQSDPSFSALKTCQDCSIAHSVQDEQHSIFSTSYARLPDSAMMLNGSVSVQEPLQVPLLESDCSWLESPGALSTGNGRPPGQTKQEAQLKKLKVLAPGEVINPEFLESSYSLPLGWTDPQDNRSASELIAEMGLSVIAAQPSVMPSIGELPPSHCSEFITSTHSSEPLVLCPVCQLQHIYLSGGCGMCGLEPQINQKTKLTKQPKGCLYKYLERKKLKDGSVIEYPRVDGERNPENLSHWRWGFNWELKIDGKWKGCSVGSIPFTIVSQIQLMQNQGASLEEIIEFIKLVKSKKFVGSDAKSRSSPNLDQELGNQHLLSR